MELGFDTIGNATLICYDRRPLLVTDPWIDGAAYFGSWTFSHEIPREQAQSIEACRYVWLSHGHPDHLSPTSIEKFKDKIILLPDHEGGRIYRALKEQGYVVYLLKDREWTRLSDRVRVLSIADYNQDGILLIDIGGKLVVDMNDANDNGWGRFVKKVIQAYKVSFLLKLSGYGDADMNNCFDDDGAWIMPWAAKRRPVGKQIALLTKQFGVKYFVPFSSMHRYQRADSVWANRYATRLADYANGFESDVTELLPAFIRYDCLREQVEEIAPEPLHETVWPPEAFGDNWSDPLTRSDVEKIKAYFSAIEHLRRQYEFIRVRVGGREHTVDLGGIKNNFGITFEAPRHSLMTAIENEIFDDLLIGNFMRTTLHGHRPVRPLYPDFTPYVAKYADNGRAKTYDELEAYFAAYRRRAPLDHFFHSLQNRSAGILRALVSPESSSYRVARSVYYRLHGMQS